MVSYDQPRSAACAGSEPTTLTHCAPIVSTGAQGVAPRLAARLVCTVGVTSLMLVPVCRLVRHTLTAWGCTEAHFPRPNRLAGFRFEKAPSGSTARLPEPAGPGSIDTGFVAPPKPVMAV